MWLKLDRPCDADWDELDGDGAVRFCRRCKKDVHDLSALPAVEAKRLVARGVCARLALGAALLAAGPAYADLHTSSKRRHVVRTPAVDPGELIEHVPHAPEDKTQTVMGAVSLASVRPPVEAIRRCYQKELQKARPDLSGRLTLKLVIANGRVESVEIRDSNLEDAELEACVLEAARSWRFPDTSAITISYPLIFDPQ